jgi:hypothetical protein
VWHGGMGAQAKFPTTLGMEVRSSHPSRDTRQQHNSCTPEAYFLYIPIRLDLSVPIQTVLKAVNPLIGLWQGLFSGTQALEIPLLIQLAHDFCY